MVALNYQNRFADMVERGEKRQTIRADGKRHPPVVGDELQHYTGMRTKNCRLLRRSICSLVVPVFINSKERTVTVFMGRTEPPIGERKILAGEQLENFAHADGFHDADAFFAFFCADESPVFKGNLIRWKV